MPWPLYPQGKSPRYTLDRRLGGPQSQSGHSGKEKNSQPLLEIELLIIQPIASHCTGSSLCSYVFSVFNTANYLHGAYSFMRR
jgi:hypothetical protein